MRVWVENTWIELSKDQISQIEQERRSLALCRRSFNKMLLKLGFKPDKKVKGWWTHNEMECFYGELSKGEYGMEFWAFGPGFMCGYFGGTTFYEPCEFEKSFLEARKRLGQSNN